MKRRAAGSGNSRRVVTPARAPAPVERSDHRANVTGTEWYERAKLPAHRTPMDLPLLELECMKILWQISEASVSKIRDILSRRRVLAYTTVETVMNRLVKKGAATRCKEGAVYIYWPQYTREEACQHALQRLVDHFFFGSRESLQAYLGGKGMETFFGTPDASQARRQPHAPATIPTPARRKAAAKPRPGKPALAGKLEPEPTAAAIDTSLL